MARADLGSVHLAYAFLLEVREAAVETVRASRDRVVHCHNPAVTSAGNR